LDPPFSKHVTDLAAAPNDRLLARDVYTVLVNPEERKLERRAPVFKPEVKSKKFTPVIRLAKVLDYLSEAAGPGLPRYEPGPPEIGDADTWPGIDRDSAVAGGAACIVRTRIPVWTLEQYRRLGCSDPDLLRIFPTLRRSDLVIAWDYVSNHLPEIDREIRENEAD